jgi:hypothetical protein
MDASGYAKDADCELCAEIRLSQWFYEDEHCWIAECIVCDVPMVVWRNHAAAPPDDVKVMLHQRLFAVVEEHFVYEPYIDDNMRQIPDHYHAHARAKGMGFFGRPLPRRARPDSSS